MMNGSILSRASLGSLFVFVVSYSSGEAFSINKSTWSERNAISMHSTNTIPHASTNRRLFLQLPFQVAVLSQPVLSANAITDKVKPLTEAEAEARFREGRKSIRYLIDNYDEICDGGGDNVRRYLGTVGSTSGLVAIGKTMKALTERADDVVEYTETMNEVEKSIQQADGSAYMSIFANTSTSYIPASKYFGDAKIEIKRCVKAMDELAELIDLKV